MRGEDAELEFLEEVVGAERGEGEGDLFAIVQIVVPPAPTDREKALFKDLADASKFDPRAAFPKGDGK